VKVRVLLLIQYFLAGFAFVSLKATTIVDIQRALDGGASPLLGQEVIVEGVITASADPANLGLVFMQQPGAVEWAGIQFQSNASVGEFIVGDLIRVTATVSEEFGLTVLANVKEAETIGTGVITPIALDPDLFSSGNSAQSEQYEGMLVELVAGEGQYLQVVQVNADGNNNFGEWRVGTDSGNPTSGCRILTGRWSSLSVSYINAEYWASNNGRLLVTPVVVKEGDRFPVVRGVITYRNGDYKLLPRTNADFFFVQEDINITFSRIHPGEQLIDLGWESFESASYRIEATSDFSGWDRLVEGITADGPEVRINEVSFPDGMRFFRIVKE
jgi:hypothetical protein